MNGMAGMNRRSFLMSSMAGFPLSVASLPLPLGAAPAAAAGEARVAVLLVDTDRVMGSIDKRIYGHFLEHINHSVVDGLFAEQIRGCGFEGEDFDTYWESFSDRGSVEIADVEFKNGKKSVRLHVEGGPRRDPAGPHLSRRGACVRRLGLGQTRGKARRS